MDSMLDVGLIVTVLGLTCRGIRGISDYYVEDAYFDRLNPEYIDVDNTNLEAVWTNSTVSGISVNLTVIKQMPPRSTGHLNVFEKTMGEYKSHSALSINLPWCKAIKDPLMIGDLLRAMNLTECPVLPGFYSIEEWHPPTSLMPIDVAGTQYKISFVVRNQKTIFLQGNVFGSVY